MGLGALGRAGRRPDPARGRCSPAEGSEVSGAAGSLRLLGRAHGQALIRVPKCALGSPQDPHHRSPWCPNVGHGLGVPHRAPCTPNLQQPGAGLGVSESPGGVWCSRAGSSGVPKSQIPNPSPRCTSQPSPCYQQPAGPRCPCRTPPRSCFSSPRAAKCQRGTALQPPGLCTPPRWGRVVHSPLLLGPHHPSSISGMGKGSANPAAWELCSTQPVPVSRCPPVAGRGRVCSSPEQLGLLCREIPQNTGVLGLFGSLAQRSSLQVPAPR